MLNGSKTSPNDRYNPAEESSGMPVSREDLHRLVPSLWDFTLLMSVT